MTITSPSEGLMTDEDTRVPPILWQTIAALLAIIIGSVGVTGWGQSGFESALRDHQNRTLEIIGRLQEDIDELRQQVVGSHNLADIMRVQRAVAVLDPDDSSNWTGDGKPRIHAIKEVLIEQGYRYLEVTASMRDLAWGLREIAE